MAAAMKACPVHGPLFAITNRLPTQDGCSVCSTPFKLRQATHKRVTHKQATHKQVTQRVSVMTMLSRKQVVGVIDALFAVACAELKKNGKFNFISMVRMALKPARAAKEGINPFTKEPCVFKAKKATIKGFTMRKFKLVLADELECHWLR